MTKPLCLVAGKSGGHILPCLSYAQQYTTAPNSKHIFFATKAQLDRSLLAHHPAVEQLITLHFGTHTYAGYTFGPLYLMIDFMRSFFTSFWYLLRTKPARIMSTGGAVSIPVCLAGWLLRIPINLYELNATPGRATRVIAFFATHIFNCFPGFTLPSAQHKLMHTDYPIRFSANQDYAPTILFKDDFGFSDTRKTICILGGSQGSVFLNNLIQQWLMTSKNLAPAIQIIHQMGNADLDQWKTLYEHHAIPAYVFNYTDAIADCYRAADIIICRSGAGTLFETIFFKKPCITIPLETDYTAHQYDNAQALASMHPDLITVFRQKTIEKDFTLFTDMLVAKLNI